MWYFNVAVLFEQIYAFGSAFALAVLVFISNVVYGRCGYDSHTRPFTERANITIHDSS